MSTQPTYRVHRLRAREMFRAMEATHLTNSGLVLGHYTDSRGNDLGVAVWRVGGPDWPAAEQLIPVPDINLRGVNDAGQFVGALNADSAQPRAVFGATSLADAPLAARAEKSEQVGEKVVRWTRNSFATGVNNSGTVIGVFNDGRNHTGFAWSSENGLVTLEAPPAIETQDDDASWPTGFAPLSVNDYGAVVGWRLGDETAFEWNLRGQLVATFEGNFIELKKITNAGHLLGWTKLPGFVSSSRVSLGGVDHVLPLLAGARDAEATDMNNFGYVVGESRTPRGGSERLPCLWSPGGEVFNLNTLIAERDVVLDRPRAINDAGWIVCDGAYRGAYGTPFVLQPSSGGAAGEG